MPSSLPDGFDMAAEADKKRFFVSSCIAGAQQKPLPSITGVWKGSNGNKGDLSLSSWDSDTAELFNEFENTGSYRIPEPVPEENTSEGGEGEEEGGEEEEGEWGRRDGVLTPGSDRSSDDREKRVGNVLLKHAQLYTLALYRNHQELERFALEQLGTALGKIVTLGRSAKDFVPVLEYVYSHTHPHTRSDKPIRNLVSKFAVENFEKLPQPEMCLLLGQQGDLAIELMKKLGERLRETEPWKDHAVALIEEVQRLELRNGEMEPLEDHIAALNEKVRKLEADREGEVRKICTMKKWIADIKKVYWGLIAQSGMGPIPGALFSTVAIVFIAIMATMYTQSVPLAARHPSSLGHSAIPQGSSTGPLPGRKTPITQEVALIQAFPHTEEAPPTHEFSQPQIIYLNSLEGICQYYSTFSWAGSNFVTIGGKSLKEACSEDPWFTQSGTPWRTQGEICHLYDTKSWFGSPASPEERILLKRACMDYNARIQRILND